MQEETIIVDIFCDTMYVCTDVALKDDTDKVKKDIEECWGFDSNKIIFYQYTEEDWKIYLEHLSKGCLCLVEPGKRTIKDFSGNQLAEITSVKKY